MTNLITVCVPVYNGAPYLSRLLDSLVSQTFEPWTALFVDDVSTDNSRDVIQHYADKDPRIQLVCRESNSGSANVPITQAVNMAQTPWVIVCGQDDWLDSDYLQRLVDRAEATQADLVVADMVLTDENEKELSRIPAVHFDRQQVISGHDAVKLTIGEWQIGANGMLSRTALQQAVSNNASTEMNIDEVNTRKVLALANRVSFVGTNYHYLIHGESITHKVTPKLFDKMETGYALLRFVMNTYPTDDRLQARQWDVCARDLKSSHYLLWAHKDLFDSETIGLRMKKNFGQLAAICLPHSKDQLKLLFKTGNYHLYLFVLRLKFFFKRK